MLCYHVDLITCAGYWMKSVKQKRKKIILFTIISFSIAVTSFSLFSSTKPLFIWNNTNSLPKGIYKISDGYTYGDIVAFDIPSTILPLIKERHYIPAYDRLIKPIVAMHGDTVCINQTTITVNGEYFGDTSLVDSKGRSLPMIEGCQTINQGYLWVMIKGKPLSLDSRYYGQVSEQLVYGKAHLLWKYGK